MAASVLPDVPQPSRVRLVIRGSVVPPDSFRPILLRSAFGPSHSKDRVPGSQKNYHSNLQIHNLPLTCYHIHSRLVSSQWTRVLTQHAHIFQKVRIDSPFLVCCRCGPARGAASDAAYDPATCAPDADDEEGVPHPQPGISRLPQRVNLDEGNAHRANSATVLGTQDHIGPGACAICHVFC